MQELSPKEKLALIGEAIGLKKKSVEEKAKQKPDLPT